jgi:ABC-type sugar transport system ATPase subunit
VTTERAWKLKLERVEQRVGAETWLYPLDLALVPRAVTVLLGATQAGKTTLMRLMAGLDAPFRGKVLADARTSPAVRCASATSPWSTSSSSTIHR